MTKTLTPLEAATFVDEAAGIASGLRLDEVAALLRSVGSPCSSGAVYGDQVIFDAIVEAISGRTVGEPVTINTKKFIEAFNNHRDRALCTALRTPAPGGQAEPVAWRWRSIFNKDHWSVSIEKPVIANEQYITEPLFASSPTQIAGDVREDSDK